MSDIMRLDERIKQAIIDLINSKHPEWVHQEEIYTYLENELEFDERQKALHHRKLDRLSPIGNTMQGIFNIHSSVMELLLILEPMFTACPCLSSNSIMKQYGVVACVMLNQILHVK